ncbi:hypothetical protein GGI22_005729 [Coemansia erecta]|nr:hypothetical protein GGI22_005729 [Coemansia erecta]
MVLKSEDVNYLVYRYLKESGFLHSSYIFQFESQIHNNDRELPNVEPGSLIRVLQKGLQYMDVETHLNEDGTARLCTAPFSLVNKHVCSVQSTSSDTPGGRRGNKSGGGTVLAASTQQQQQQQHQQRIEDGASEQNSSTNHGGHTLVHDAASSGPKDAKKYPKARNAVIQHQAAASAEAALVANGAMDGDRMDVDVPDTEKENLKNSSDSGKAARKQRLIERVQVLRGHTSPVFLCAWAPMSGSNTLATGAGDGTSRIWDLTKPKGDSVQFVTLRHDPETRDAGARLDVTAIVWNPSGSLLATACFSGQLRVWTAAGEPKYTLRHRPVPVISMRWNRKGNLLLAACLDGSICLWDIQTGTLRREYKGHAGSVLDVDWLDNSTFASCAADKSIVVWRDDDSDGTSPVKTFTGHKSDVNTIKWHPGGKLLASASDDGTVKVWSTANDAPIHDFFGHSQQVYVIKWLPRSDKSIIASASFDGTVRIWDIQSNSCLRVLSAHSEAVHCLAFSSDGRYLASGSFDKKVCIWNVKDGSLFTSFNADDGIHDIQWAAKGKIAVAVANGHVVVFDPLAPS